MADALVAGLEIVVLTVGAVVAAGAWTKVAQREHYQPGRVSVFARMWLASSPVNAALWAAGLLAAVVGFLPVGRWSAAAVVAGLVAVVWPVGMARPWDKPRLAVTPRVRRLLVAEVAVVAAVVALLAVGLRDAAPLLVVPLLMPLLVDLALAAVRPVEQRLGQRYVDAAQRKLARVAPRIVAITGSYGKTSTKSYLAHLAGEGSGVVASPASFNNIMGLARSVNERLHPGDVVFVAEMGTYGPGEIRRLCELFPPDVSAITTIGEAHLERMGSRANVARAKAEILERASTAVLNVDSPELAALVPGLREEKTVLLVSGGHPEAGLTPDVLVCDEGGQWTVTLPGMTGPVTVAPPPAAHTGNLAVALGLALALDLPPAQLLERMRTLPTADHRAEMHTLPTGVTVIDDTYNSNPIGAASALRAAVASAADGGTIYVVTPGMVELGAVQHERNQEFGRQVGSVGHARLVVTHRTNRRALLEGAQAAGGQPPATYASRPAAAERVFAEARSGDVVLFENDLPDHYP